MAKNHVLPRYLLRAAVCVCVLLGGGFLSSVFHAKNAKVHAKFAKNSPWRPLRISTAPLRTLRETYQSEIGTKEATGRNDGPRVGEYLRYCGLDEGYAWCAAFVSWCHGQAGYTEPRNAWAAALFPKSKTIWTQAWERTGDASRNTRAGSHASPRVGDIFGIYYTNLKRIGHCGFVDGWDEGYCFTVEGNTGPDGAVAADGDPANPIRAGPARDGVYRKRRPIRTIKAVARWIK